LTSGPGDGPTPAGADPSATSASAPERAGTTPRVRPPAAAWAAVLFDLDGTLADTVGLILSCYRHTMRTHRGEVLPDEAWIRGMGTPLREQLGAFARSPEELEAMLLTYGTYQRAHHDAMVSPYPQVPALLDALEAARVTCALVTSRRPELTLRTLRHCGILRHFEVIVTPDDVRRAKPHPEPVLVALARLDSPPPERVLFVGDSPHDIESGHAAGVRTAGALWGPFPRAAVEAAHPDFLVHEPLELLDLTP